MQNADAIPELDRAGLRQFGIVTGAIVVLLFGLFFPWLLDHTYPIWPWVVSHSSAGSRSPHRCS